MTSATYFLISSLIQDKENELFDFDLTQETLEYRLDELKDAQRQFDEIYNLSLTDL